MKDPYFKHLGLVSAAEEMLRRQQHLEELLKPSATARLIEQVESATTAAKMFERLHQSKLWDFTHSDSYLKAIEASTSVPRIADFGARLEMAHLAAPRATELLRLSELAAERVRPFEVLVQRAAWKETLAQRMALIEGHWALPDGLEDSAEAFARLSRLSDVARFAPAYTDETAEVVADELGEPSQGLTQEETIEQREARYDDAGRARDLIAFPPARYSQILVSAGYAVVFPAPPVVDVEDGLIEPVRFSPETGFLLQSLEAHLRQLVAARLRAIEGDAWIRRRVPIAVRDKWNEGRSAAKAAGKPVLAPIHYANFMDLADIIAAGNNWPEFEALFTSRDNLRVGLLRLYYIRNDVAHARPISMTDELIAIAEGTLLFRAMGLAVQYGT